MRKITLDSIHAFNNNIPFNKSNTSVIIDDDIVMLSLFGNIVAHKYTNSNVFEITNCGYFTNVTKERLNGFAKVSIVQRNYIWYLNGEQWDGNLIEIK